MIEIIEKFQEFTS